LLLRVVGLVVQEVEVGEVLVVFLLVLDTLLPQERLTPLLLAQVGQQHQHQHQESQGVAAERILFFPHLRQRVAVLGGH
jgi:hypothetical protein